MEDPNFEGLVMKADGPVDLMFTTKKLQEEIENCGECCEDELCKRHLMKRQGLEHREDPDPEVHIFVRE